VRKEKESAKREGMGEHNGKKNVSRNGLESKTKLESMYGVGLGHDHR